VEEALGHWEAIRQLQARTEGAVAANAGTPCVFNARVLRSCALASAGLGLEAEARRLEHDATALGFEGYGWHLDPLAANLALIRGDLDQVRALLDGSGDTWHQSMDSGVHGAATRLDALVALGRTGEVESEAARLAQPGTYLEPFALRALGLVRGDPVLLAHAVERFDAMGLEWQASKTRATTPSGGPHCD
jgi:hypothetical protein